MAEFKTRTIVLLLSVFILALVFFVDSTESVQHQISDGSSLLESIIGKYGGFGIGTGRSLVFPLHKIDQGREYAEFTHLPGKRFTDFGIGTGRSLVLQLHKIDQGREYGEFMHLPGKRFYDFASVSKEIEGETGSGKGISSVPIHLSIYSPDDGESGSDSTVADMIADSPYPSLFKHPNELKDPSQKASRKHWPVWLWIIIAVFGTGSIFTVGTCVIWRYYPKHQRKEEPEKDLELGEMRSSSSVSSNSSTDSICGDHINPLTIL